MRKGLLALTLGVAMGLGAVAGAEAMPAAAPGGAAAAPEVILVSGGCGPAFHRTPWGGCRPNGYGRPYGFYGHPYHHGWHRWHHWYR